MFYLGAVIHENSQIIEPIPNFPASINSTLLNFPFKRFIIPALLDTAIIYIQFPFLPFFVEYILDPLSACESNSVSIDSLKCRTTYWIGFIVVSYVLGALISLPLWIIGLKKFEAKVAWGFGSVFQVLALPFLAACRDSYMVVAMLVFFALGLSQGGSFIQRMILGDIIDYEEYLQFRRSEGTYVG